LASFFSSLAFVYLPFSNGLAIRVLLSATAVAAFALWHYMPFFFTIEDFLPFAGAAFLANFLFAAFTVFMPCLSLGLPQPQVAHIIFYLS
jgi:hypothetical protein